MEQLSLTWTIVGVFGVTCWITWMVWATRNVWALTHEMNVALRSIQVEQKETSLLRSDFKEIRKAFEQLEKRLNHGILVFEQDKGNTRKEVQTLFRTEYEERLKMLTNEQRDATTAIRLLQDSCREAVDKARLAHGLVDQSMNDVLNRMIALEKGASEFRARLRKLVKEHEDG